MQINVDIMKQVWHIVHKARAFQLFSMIEFTITRCCHIYHKNEIWTTDFLKLPCTSKHGFRCLQHKVYFSLHYKQGPTENKKTCTSYWWNATIKQELNTLEAKMWSTLFCTGGRLKVASSKEPSLKPSSPLLPIYTIKFPSRSVTTWIPNMAIWIIDNFSKQTQLA